jgi:histone deacetylase HOS3
MGGEPSGTPRSSNSRRPSFAPSMHSSNGPLPPPAEEKLPLRACDVAQEHFKKDLARHEGNAGVVDAGTIVIVHDQCYGHRFSRPKTSKTMLSLIMERPERILASVLGISAAYVRLGERHSEGSHPPHPDLNPPERVPFRIHKTSRLVDITSQVVTNVHGTKWMEELKTMCNSAGEKLASTGKELARNAPTEPGQPPQHEFHSGDLYLCPESLNAFQGALGGVLDAVDAVFQTNSMGQGPSRAFVCVRPPGHHCSADFPSGFCWLNNVHVGIEHAIQQYGLTHAAIIDFDLHHGDGSQAITWARNKKVQNMPKSTANRKKTSIGYFSLHDINSYPCEDGDDDKVQAASLCIDNAHGQSIWNVHLQPWKTIEEFWAIYETKYLVLLEKTRQYLKSHTARLRSLPNQPTPKAAIFLSAGFDASEWETAGMQRHAVNVPTEFYARFTRDVVRLAGEDDTAVDGRVISVLEGGYSDRALASGVFSHISGLTDGQVWNQSESAGDPALDMHQRLARMTMGEANNQAYSVETERTPVVYDPQWWSAARLSELENLVAPPPAAAVKKLRQGSQAHFSSPTQSFVAKVVDPSKLRVPSGSYPTNPIPRAPTPPPPDVDWATAVHALSSLLIPADRQTRSCRPEELAEPRVKKEKPVAPPVLASVKLDSSGRQLRGRKPVSTYADAGSEDEHPSRAESRTDRRQTIADFPLAAVEPLPAPSASRRMSIPSTASSIGDRSAIYEPSGPPVTSGRKSAVPSAANSLPAKKSRGPAATSTARAPARPTVPRVPSAHTSKPTEAKEKENDGIDALTSGLKRVTLKMPSREEYEAREREKAEKQKIAETSKKVTAKANRKPPSSRTTAKPASESATAPIKKGRGRPSRSSKSVTPVESPTSASAPEPPVLQSAAMAPLEQPHPVQLESASDLAHLLEPVQGFPETLATGTLNEVGRRTSDDIMEPPTDLRDMVITPEQLREQLPIPSFVTKTETFPTVRSPPRADTPPQPPPSAVPQFVNYTPRTFGSDSAVSSAVTSPGLQAPAPLQWLPPNTDTAPAPMSSESLPTLPPVKRQDLPVFTPDGVIPFAHASSPGLATPSADVARLPLRNSTDLSVDPEDKKNIWEVPDTLAR